jgi:type VI protein secretion system component VasK
MRRKNLAKVIVGFAVFALVFVTVFGWAVHQLWNVLMPELFGLPRIGFWQALGLLTLSWLLFGGWRGMPRRRHSWGGGPCGRWEGLTAEERKRLARRMFSGEAGEAPPGQESESA